MASRDIPIQISEKKGKQLWFIIHFFLKVLLVALRDDYYSVQKASTRQIREMQSQHRCTYQDTVFRRNINMKPENIRYVYLPESFWKDTSCYVYVCFDPKLVDTYVYIHDWNPTFFGLPYVAKLLPFQQPPLSVYKVANSQCLHHVLGVVSQRVWAFHCHGLQVCQVWLSRVSWRWLEHANDEGWCQALYRRIDLSKCPASHQGC